MKVFPPFLRKLLWLGISLLLTAMVLFSLTYVYLDSQLPDVEALKTIQLPLPLRVYSSDGQLIAEFGEISRSPVKLNEVPPLLIKAILATEDQRFYEHSGVDMFGLMRATGELLLTGSKVQGGSTITMQVARNFYLTRKKTFIRKLTEILLAMKIEREFTKDEILELYLNKIYLGNRAYGVAAAAQVYYGKPLNQLTLPELAMIAGLPKAPSTINPVANPIAAKDRRDHVLTRMHDLGYISNSEYQAAMRAPITASYHGTTIPVKAPYVAEMVRDMMVTSYGDDAYTKGYNVYTTISAPLQQAANQALRTQLLAYDHRHGYRGPERNLGLYNPDKQQSWLKILLRMYSVNGLKPAAVINVTANNATALLANGQIIVIPWQNMRWARPQLKNGNLSSRIPRTPADVVKVGDVIRTQLTDNGWELDQIPTIEGALVALNPQNGAIEALVGGFDFRLSKFNRVIQAQRQPGSSFKPFIYSAALAKGYTLASIIDDAPICYTIPGQDAWCPRNTERDFQGPTRLRVALARSINIVTIKLLQAIDVPYALKYLTRFGFDASKLPRNLTLALGSGEITPLEAARGYAVFANGGYRITPFLIDRITDNQNNVIYQSQPKYACESCIKTANSDDTASAPTANTNLKPDQIAPEAIPPQIAFLMTSALQDVIRYGTGAAAKVLDRDDLAGKTGTTNDWVDTWFSGFNSDIVASTWVGFDQPSSVHEYGAQAALPMWIDFMRVALAGKPEHTMPEPAGIVQIPIDPVTGLRVSDDTPGAILEYFRSDMLPQSTPSPDAASGTTNNPPGKEHEPLF